MKNYLTLVRAETNPANVYVRHLSYNEIFSDKHLYKIKRQIEIERLLKPLLHRHS